MEHIRKLEQFLFYFLFFAIPLQTRNILYYSGWYFNEWQSISIYATDLILVALFVFWAVDKRLRKSFIHRYDYFLIGFLAVAAISVKNSSDLYVGGFLWLKLTEFSLFYFYLKTYAIHKFDFMKVLYILVLGGVFQAVIAIGQFLKQGSLGLTSFGESVIGPHMQGVASFFVVSGEKVIRAYGTTPHPNILAAYLFLTVVAIYFVVFYPKSKYYDSLMYQSIVHGVILFGLFFTFSRTIIFLFFMNFFVHGFLVNFIKRFREEYLFGSFFKTKVLPILLVTVIATTTFVFFYWLEVQSRMSLSSEEEAVQLRVFYNEESLEGDINLFGVGLGDFTGWLMEQNPNLPRYMYQPVHNIYLLIYSETGIIGFIMFLLFLAGLLYEFVKKTRLRDLKHYSFLLVAVSVLFIGLFDHFLLTLQQGRFVFWLGLTILAIGDTRKEKSETSS